jgi:aspartate-semialdehyde dehydrogenase
MKKYNIAVVGATGVVGRETLDILSERNFPYNKVFAIASSDSLGRKVSFGRQDLHIDLLEDVNWREIDIVFSSAGSKVTKLFVDQLPPHCVLIDKTSLYRLDKDVPLLIPEINIKDLPMYKRKNIIANPNCCVIPLALVLKPLNDLIKIKRVVVSTYQSMSGAGKGAMESLYEQTKNKFVYLGDEEMEEDGEVEVVKSNIAFNITPQIGPILDGGYSDEESKIMAELHRLFGEQMKVTVTSVRVPVFISHCFSVNIEFSDSFDLNDLKRVLNDAKGVVLSSKAVTPTDASGSDDVFVSRVRLDASASNSVNLWIASDNLRKGAALNAVQIAESLVSML